MTTDAAMDMRRTSGVEEKVADSVASALSLVRVPCEPKQHGGAYGHEAGGMNVAFSRDTCFCSLENILPFSWTLCESHTT